MKFFSYQGGALCAEKTPLVSIAREFGTPCYVYSRAALESAYLEFERACAGTRCARLLRRQSQFESRHPQPVRPARFWLRHRLRRGTGSRPRCWRRRREDRVLGSRQERSRDARSPASGHPLLQRRVRVGARAAGSARSWLQAGSPLSHSGSTRTSTLVLIPTSPPDCAKASSESPCGGGSSTVPASGFFALLKD